MLVTNQDQRDVMRKTRVPVISWCWLDLVYVYSQVLCWSWLCLISTLQRVDNSLLSLLLYHISTAPLIS